jgi:hypothetical protein
MPTQRQYYRALKELMRSGLHPKKREMLRAHYAASGRTVTMAVLARHVGYSGFWSGNLHYGTLGFALAQAGEFDLPIRNFGLSAIATAEQSPDSYSGHVAFTMRAQLAAALEQLGLVKNARPPKELQMPESYLEVEERKRFMKEKVRERRARDDKIQERLSRGLPLRCEVPGCGFDFAKTYGERGRGFIEVHHNKPLAQAAGTRKLRLADLALVCSNCHAMIHRYGDTLKLKDVRPRRRR